MVLYAETSYNPRTPRQLLIRRQVVRDRWFPKLPTPAFALPQPSRLPLPQPELGDRQHRESDPKRSTKLHSDRPRRDNRGRSRPVRLLPAGVQRGFFIFRFSIQTVSRPSKHRAAAICPIRLLQRCRSSLVLRGRHPLFLRPGPEPMELHRPGGETDGQRGAFNDKNRSLLRRLRLFLQPKGLRPPRVLHQVPVHLDDRPVHLPQVPQVPRRRPPGRRQAPDRRGGGRERGKLEVLLDPGAQVPPVSGPQRPATGAVRPVNHPDQQRHLRCGRGHRNRVTLFQVLTGN